MKNRTVLITTALLLLPAAGAMAADGADVSGSMQLGVRGVDDQDNSAKFKEYRDLDDGVFGKLNLKYFNGSYYFSVKGKNIGLDDQYYLLDGGSYDNFKYSFQYDEIPHNLSFGAKTFYSGIGSGNLTIGVADPQNELSWQNFDYTVDRKNYGGQVEVSLHSPFFVDFGVNRQEKHGLKPLGTGEFSGEIEMPEPVDYETNDISIAGGYRSTEILFKVSGMLSSFDNTHDSLNWTNPFTGANEVNTLPPDNDYGKIDANLTWRNLPLMSALLVNGSYSNLSNDISINELNMTAPAGLNLQSFDGDVSYTTVSASLVSRPTNVMDTRLYFDYLDKNNDSTVISYTGGGNEEDLFDYNKSTAGLDFNYRLAMQTKLSAGYEYKNIDRNNRPDVDSNTDNLVFIKLKNTSMDFLTAKLEYSYLDRDADQDFDLTGITVYDSEYIEQYVKRFDNTSKKKNEVKLAFEVYPMDTFDVGLEYSFIYNDYQDVTLGRTNDKGHKVYLDFGWRPVQMLNLTGFAGYEKTKADSNHYAFTPGSGTPPQTANPTVNDGNPSSYRWTESIDDDFWTLGLNAQVPVAERLKLDFSWQYQQSDGKNDFTTEGTTALLPIDQADDYDITTLEAKALYALTEQMDLTLGYLYERTSYKDIQYLGYDYQPPGSYLSGAYADHDYESHVGYFTVKYHF